MPRMASGAGLPTSPAPLAAPDAPDALPPGARVGEYEIDSLLRAGGFSLIYLARDRARERRVALEEYLPMPLAGRGGPGQPLRLRQPGHADAFERGLQAFLAESDLLARCQHPALPRVLRRWRANGTAYREMSHAPATSLRALRDGLAEPPDEDTLRLLLDGLLGALEVLHAAGHVHGGVSPDTIVLRSEDDSPLLLGFDAAQRAIVGSQAQALMRSIGVGQRPGDGRDGGEPGPGTDVQGVAAVIRYCIEGGRDTVVDSATRPAFTAAETLTQIAARLGYRFPGLHYSAPFLAAIDGALNGPAQDRPKNVAQFRAALNLRGRGGTAWSRAQQAVPPPLQPSQVSPQVSQPPLRPSQPHPQVSPPPLQPSQPQPSAGSTATEPAGTARTQALPPRAPPELSQALGAAEDFGAERISIELPARRAELPSATLPQRVGIWAGFAALAAAMVFGGWHVRQQWQHADDERGLARITEGSEGLVVLPASPRGRPPGGSSGSEAWNGAGTGTGTGPGQGTVTGTGQGTETGTGTATSTGTGMGTASVPDAGAGSGIASLVDDEPPAAGPVTEVVAPVPVGRSAAPAAEAEAGDGGPARAGSGLPGAPETAPAAPAPTFAPLLPRTAPTAATVVPAKPSAPPAAARPRVATGPADPLAVCSPRTQFSLYRCMQTQCAKPQWRAHPQCVRLRTDDRVG